MFATVGVGLIVTSTVKVLPAQLPEVGVTVYCIITGAVVLLVIVPVTEDPFPAVSPEIPVCGAGAAQAYCVPGGTIPSVPFTGVKVKALPLQADPDIAVMAGLGLTVMVTVKSAPKQFPEGDKGVTV
jgi:hypothetical protein